MGCLQNIPHACRINKTHPDPRTGKHTAARIPIGLSSMTMNKAFACYCNIITVIDCRCSLCGETVNKSNEYVFITAKFAGVQIERLGFYGEFRHLLDWMVWYGVSYQCLMIDYSKEFFGWKSFATAHLSLWKRIKNSRSKNRVKMLPYRSRSIHVLEWTLYK